MRGSLGPEEAVEVVAASGGAPVIAHPYSLRMGDAELERFVGGLVRHGLRGVECYRPDHDDAQRAFTLRLCAQLDLVPTGGSDWHGRPATRGWAMRARCRCLATRSAARPCISTPSA